MTWPKCNMRSTWTIRGANANLHLDITKSMDRKNALAKRARAYKWRGGGGGGGGGVVEHAILCSPHGILLESSFYLIS